MFRTAVMSALVLATSITTASAETITVCASGCDYTSINAAIADASDGDVIQLAAETYFEGEQIDTLGKAITLRGVLDKAGEPASVLDGAGTHRVLICRSGETNATVFERLVIQNGNSSDNGGGMFNLFSSPTLTDCTFMDNSAGLTGGGMRNSSSSPTLTDCTFMGNSAGDYGGGMSNAYTSPTLINCTLTSNTAYIGGGMSNSNGSSPTLTDCTFIGNSADLLGGGIGNINNSTTPTLINCTFTSNTAYIGGGMSNFPYASSPTLANCTFMDNSADYSGGGMYNSGGNSTLTNCTFTNNSAPFGGGMSNDGSSPTLTDCTFTECCQIHPPRSITDLGGNDYDSWCDDCRANIDCRNDAVDAEDLGYLLARWDTDDPQSDIDGDGLVTASDLGFLFAAWGPCN